uniref:Uncharacterized protein n=1 Tax=Panagrellus redivivus TaxID=6233 RepID=A0A7E4UYU1_PANRE
MHRCRTSSRSRSRSRSSYKQGTRRLLEFSLNATWDPTGKLGNHSVELNWAELQRRHRSSRKSRSRSKSSSRSTEPTRTRSRKPTTATSSTHDVDINDLVAITNKSATRTLTDPDFAGTPGPPEKLPSTNDGYRYPAVKCSSSNSRSTTDVYRNSPRSTKTRTCTKSCCTSAISPISVSQMVRLVSVDLRVAFFEWPGLIVRKQVVREIRNDLTVLEVLQHLIRCAGIRLE